VRADLANQVGRVVGFADHFKSGASEHGHDAGANERLILADHDPESLAIADAPTLRHGASPRARSQPAGSTCDRPARTLIAWSSNLRL
jgi:hypothetical protein